MEVNSYTSQTFNIIFFFSQLSLMPNDHAGAICRVPSLPLLGNPFGQTWCSPWHSISYSPTDCFQLSQIYLVVFAADQIKFLVGSFPLTHVCFFSFCLTHKGDSSSKTSLFTYIHSVINSNVQPVWLGENKLNIPDRGALNARLCWVYGLSLHFEKPWADT